ncbi:uncharacterized protein BKA55DRAFT_588120 [Fusarium redolens]|uniref:arginine--tRNA ligase n=1 Tax=Fusarium redolens TaxID=48865 RepID=A0A9P9R7Q1_FUSRE|nr:uncharacterized protein BKA55DRAFT_588120 [Fusarium redolens]KAH7269391.1 hypothetical protein BKA55DRAFT_588120 [Fusarium redolens]
MVIPLDENKSYLDVLHDTGLEIDEIPAFMTPYPSSPRWERRVLFVEGFCEGADFTLRNFVPDDAGSSRLQDTQEPKAWVSDRNLIHPRNGQSRRAYGRIVNNIELYEIVQQKVRMLSSVASSFPESHNTLLTLTAPRYISNPNGVSILALLRTAPASHVFGFRKLFAGYLNPNPIADLSLSDANWWGAANFVISFNLPFFAIGTQDNQDSRTLSGNQYLRARYDLDFLYLRDESITADQQDNTSFHERAVLHEAVYSLVITGRSERYWTAVCLDDDFFEEEPRLAEEEVVEASEDPIIIQAELKATGTTRSPRAYALASLEKELEKIVEYHGNVQDWFSKSLDRYTNIARGDDSQGVETQQIPHWEKRFPDMLDRVIYFNSNIVCKVNDFLAGHVMLGQKELLQGPLWQGLQGDYGALGSLRGIKSSFSQLSDIAGHLKILKEKEKVFRREPETRPLIHLFCKTHHYCRIIVAMAATTCSVSGIENLLGRVGLDTPIPEFPGADIVHNPQDIFRVYLADTLEKLLHCDRMVAYDAIQTSNVTGMGDLVIVAPRLRLKNVKPEDLVKDLLQKLPRTPPFGCPLRDGIRLQVFFSPNTLPRLLLSYISDRSASYGYDTSIGLADTAAPDGSKKKVIVEYSSPNMASEFQVSHLRSTLVGTYIANIHASMGWDVVKMNYLGDWGKQIGLLAAGWERFGSEDEFAKQPLRHLLEVNHKIQDLFKPEMDECKIAKAKGQDVTEIESRGLYAERDIFFKKMEDKEPGAIAVWQRFRDATVKDYTDSYAQLGVTFDEYSGESQVTAESIAEVEQILKEKGIYEEHDDSWKIDFSKHDAKGLSLAVVRYRNGTTSYLLRDLAAVFDRYKKHKFDKMIYVVAMEQEMHFHRVTKTLELMGRQDLAERIQHVPFAKINGLPEELKEAALLSDYLDGCRSMSDVGLDGEEEEASYVDKSENSVKQLSLAGLFIQDQYHKRATSYAIDPKKMISLEGETGAAIQNCYARLLAQVGSEPVKFDYTTLDHNSLETADYSELLRILLQYPDAAHGSFKTLEPSFIVGYLLRLVDQLMQTLDDDDEKDWTGLETANEARLALYGNTRQVFENALRLLGVAPWSP